MEGVRGGGKVAITPFSIDDLALGGVAKKGIVGVFGAFPETLEYSLGFRIGGIISHQFFRTNSVTFDFDSMQIVIK